MARLKQQGNRRMITRRRRRKATSATLSQICCPRVNKPIGHDCDASYHSIIIYSLIRASVPSYQLHCNCWKREAMFKWTGQWATHHSPTSSWTTYESIVHHQALNRALCAPYCGSTALCNDAEIFHGFFALIGGLCNVLIFNHQCTMCILGSTMALWSKAEIQKYTFWWEKNIFEAIFPMLF